MMGEPIYDLKTLFEQLGLSAEQEDIERFIREHQLEDDRKLHEASFWSPQQSAFLKDSLENDANWAEVVDELNLRLHS